MFQVGQATRPLHAPSTPRPRTKSPPSRDLECALPRPSATPKAHSSPPQPSRSLLSCPRKCYLGGAVRFILTHCTFGECMDSLLEKEDSSPRGATVSPSEFCLRVSGVSARTPIHGGEIRKQAAKRREVTKAQEVKSAPSPHAENLSGDNLAGRDGEEIVGKPLAPNTSSAKRPGAELALRSGPGAGPELLPARGPLGAEARAGSAAGAGPGRGRPALVPFVPSGPGARV